MRGKNLSTSFCLLQNEFDEEIKANAKEEEIRKLYHRTDSGFNDESNSNFSMMDHFEPIDENKESFQFKHHNQMPIIKEPLKMFGNRMILKSRHSSVCESNENLSVTCDVSMQSETDFIMCSTQQN